jgi:plasmid stabilization system protein ParE
MTDTWRVVVTPRAATDIANTRDWLHARSPRAAAQWLVGLRGVVEGLATMPLSHPLAPEAPAFDIEIRRALYRRGTPWRNYFTAEVAARTVHVLHVRHGHRSLWSPGTG